MSNNYVSHGRYTRAQYNALTSVDPNCIYLITDEGQILHNGVSYGYYAKNVEAVKSVTYSAGVLTISWVNDDPDTTYNIYDFTVGDGLSLGEAINGVKTIDLKLDGTTLAKGANGLKTNIQVKKLDTPSNNTVAASYQLQDGSGNALGATIDIAKDQHIKSVELIKLTTAIDGVGAKDDDCLKIIWILANGSENTTYINVADFLREAEAGNGIEIVAGKYNAKLDPATETFLTVSANGIKLAGVQNAINTAAAAAKTEVSAKTTGHVTVALDTTAADGHTKVNISENDIASAALLGTASDTATSSTIDGVTTYSGATAFAKIDAEAKRATDIESALANLLTWKEA